MKIHSKFKDYYDGGAAMGIDPSLHYVRDTRELLVKDCPLPNRWFVPRVYLRAQDGSKAKIKTDWRNDDAEFWFDGLNYHLDRIIVYFCGKCYMGHGLFTTGDTWSGKSSTGYPSFDNRGYLKVFWSFEALTHWLDEFGLYVYDGRDRPRYWDDRKPDRHLAESFDRHDVSAESLNWLINNKVVAMASVAHTKGAEPYWMVDPRLSDLTFISAVDAYQAWQDISMYLGGILSTPSNPPVEISDTVRSQKHGFDKWSFRKPPQKASS